MAELFDWWSTRRTGRLQLCKLFRCSPQRHLNYFKPVHKKNDILVIPQYCSVHFFFFLFSCQYWVHFNTVFCLITLHSSLIYFFSQLSLDIKTWLLYKCIQHSNIIHCFELKGSLFFFPSPLCGCQPISSVRAPALGTGPFFWYDLCKSAADFCTLSVLIPLKRQMFFSFSVEWIKHKLLIKSCNIYLKKDV